MVHAYIALVLCLIFVGVYFRRKKRIHVPIMLSSLVLDLSAVVYLELDRNVIMKAYERTPEALMKVHLVFAVFTLLGYGLALVTGINLLRGNNKLRYLHRLNACIFLIARVGVLITSFWIPLD